MEERMTWAEAHNYLRKFNEEHNITIKGCGEATASMVAVMTPDSFDKEYDERGRSYAFTNHNKAFLPNMCSNSIFASCLDGTDDGVRLDWYVPTDWTVDYCYILDVTE